MVACLPFSTYGDFCRMYLFSPFNQRNRIAAEQRSPSSSNITTVSLIVSFSKEKSVLIKRI